jgi:chromosomal replication initiator protein
VKTLTLGADSLSKPSQSEQTPEERILAMVFSEVGAERYARFFDRQTHLNLGSGHLDVTVPTGFAAQLLDRKFGELLRRAASTGAPIGGTAGTGAAPVELRFRVDGAAFGAGAAPTALRREAPRARPAPVRHGKPVATDPAGRYRLEDFVVGDANRLAFSAVQDVCRGRDAGRISTLFIHGRCGVGKTHLLQGTAARCHEGGAVVRCTTAETFTNEFITAVRANRIDAFRKSYRGVEVLCIDDVHFLSAKQGTQAELLHTFDALNLGGARVVLASDEHPRAIQKLSESLSSRFMAGLVVRLDEPDPALREQLVRKLAERRGLSLDDGAARLIATRGGGAPGQPGGSVRDLEGLVTRVEAVTRLLAGQNAPVPVIDGTMVRRALGLSAAGERPAGSRPRRPIRVETIAAEVCGTLGVDIGELRGRCRHARVVVARSLTAYLSRRLTTMSFPEIARAMARPNHSSVITAFRRVEGQIRDGLLLGADYGGVSLADLAAQLEERLVRGAIPA